METPLDLIARPEDCALKVPIAETTCDPRFAASCRRDHSGSRCKENKTAGIAPPFPAFFLGFPSVFLSARRFMVAVIVKGLRGALSASLSA